MNLWSVSSLGIGAMVGAGIFAVLGQAAVIAGGGTYIAFILGGLVAALSGYSYAKLAVRYPEAGGVSAYFDQAFGKGRGSGTLSLIYVLTIAVTVALVAKAFGAYAAPLLLGRSDPLWVNVFACAIVILLALLNVVGSSLVGRAEAILVGIKLIILAALMLSGGASLIGKHSVAPSRPDIMGVFGCVGLTFLAYAGYDNTANAASSVKNPKRIIPLAMCVAIGVVILLYVGLSLVVLANVSTAGLAQDSDTAVAEAAKPVLGPAGYVVVSIGALLATASGINAWIFNGINISSSLAKNGQLPKIFAQTLCRKGSRGFVLSIAGILLIIVIFDLSALSHIASATFLVIYLAVQLAHWRLIRETGASKIIVGTGLLALGAVLTLFIWTTARSQPYSIALIAAFIAASGLAEALLMKKQSPPAPNKLSTLKPYPSSGSRASDK